jgi:hypothetical protein
MAKDTVRYRRLPSSRPGPYDLAHPQSALAGRDDRCHFGAGLLDPDATARLDIIACIAALDCRISGQIVGGLIVRRSEPCSPPCHLGLGQLVRPSVLQPCEGGLGAIAAELNQAISGKLVEGTSSVRPIQQSSPGVKSLRQAEPAARLIRLPSPVGIVKREEEALGGPKARPALLGHGRVFNTTERGGAQLLRGHFLDAQEFIRHARVGVVYLTVFLTPGFARHSAHLGAPAGVSVIQPMYKPLRKGP